MQAYRELLKAQYTKVLLPIFLMQYLQGNTLPRAKKLALRVFSKADYRRHLLLHTPNMVVVNELVMAA